MTFMLPFQLHLTSAITMLHCHVVLDCILNIVVKIQHAIMCAQQTIMFRGKYQPSSDSETKYAVVNILP